MATIPPGRWVLLDDDALRRLRFPPPGSEAVIGVHGGALHAAENRLTLAVCLDDDDDVVWVGALDERMVLGSLGSTASPRPAVAACLFRGDRAWMVVRPGELLVDTGSGPYQTVYQGDRPWVVLGALPSGPVLAAPLNDARGNPKWYAPRVAAGEVEGDASAKEGQLEMAHLWSLPEDLPVVGEVVESARDRLRKQVAAYYC